jgi:hypothetical protein
MTYEKPKRYGFDPRGNYEGTSGPSQRSQRVSVEATQLDPRPAKTPDRSSQ